ncbi:42029_t:CDS:2, partial [Gigaspora margarita]
HPRQLQWWRIFIILILLFLLSVSCALLLENMIEEEPSIKISYDKNVNSLPLPNFYFTWDKHFRIRCNTTYCNKFFSNDRLNNSIYNNVRFSRHIWFLPNGTLTFNDTPTAFPINFLFEIYVNDTTYNSSIETRNINFIAFDSEFLKYKNQPRYIDLFNTQNHYYLTQGRDGENYYYLKYRRKERQDMDQSFFTKIGFIPKYFVNTYHYIESGIQIIPYPRRNSDPNFFAGLYVNPWTMMVELEKEQK